MNDKPRTVLIDGKQYLVDQIKKLVNEYKPQQKVKVGNIVTLSSSIPGDYLVAQVESGRVKLIDLNDGNRLSDKAFDHNQLACAVPEQWKVSKVYASMADYLKAKRDPIAW